MKTFKNKAKNGIIYMYIKDVFYYAKGVKK